MQPHGSASCQPRPRVATDGGEPEDEPRDVAKVRLPGSEDSIDFHVGSSWGEDEILYLDFKDESAIRSLVGFAASAMHGDDLRVEGVDNEDLSLDDLAQFFPFESNDVDEEEEVVADGGVPYHDLTAFQRDLLWSVVELEEDESTETYGLAIKRQVEETYRKEINHGRLYPNLDELAEKGLVEKSALDDRTNEYRPTAAARMLLRRVATDRADLVESAEAVATDGGRDE